MQIHAHQQTEAEGIASLAKARFSPRRSQSRLERVPGEDLMRGAY
jgi:hypothetical protein